MHQCDPKRKIKIDGDGADESMKNQSMNE